MIAIVTDHSTNGDSNSYTLHGSLDDSNPEQYIFWWYDTHPKNGLPCSGNIIFPCKGRDIEIYKEGSDEPIIKFESLTRWFFAECCNNWYTKNMNPLWDSRDDWPRCPCCGMN